MRTDRLELAAVERPQALNTAEPLAIALSSVLVKHRVTVVTPQRSNHRGTSFFGAPAHASRLILGLVAHHIVARSLAQAQEKPVALIPFPDRRGPA